MNNSAIDRNVVILFNDSLRANFIKLSQGISKKIPSKIKLNTANEIPHITLYMSKYPEKNEELIIDKIAEIANKTKPFKIRLNQKSCHSTGTIFIDAEMSNELYSLHEKLVDSLNPLREGLFNEDTLSLPGLTEETKESLRKFGMWAVKKAYVPHISVGRIHDTKDCQVALNALPDKIDYEELVESIAFAEIGHDGTCKKIFNTFKLRG